jgi:hypothetical protein
LIILRYSPGAAELIAPPGGGLQSAIRSVAPLSRPWYLAPLYGLYSMLSVTFEFTVPPP